MKAAVGDGIVHGTGWTADAPEAPGDSDFPSDEGTRDLRTVRARSFRESGAAAAQFAQEDGTLISTDEKARVLVVEDDADTREILRELLSPRFEIAFAADGEAGAALARETTPDLILMDISLPKLDGMSVLEELQRESTTMDIPVIFLSGRQDEGTVVRCLNQGAADYLAKPANAGELIARISRAIKQSKQRRLLQALAQTDALTGLSNFRSLVTRLDEEFKRASRYRYPLSAAMIDLDYLKQINDSLGHEIGNNAITALARHLRLNLREVDFAARYGGDEFFVLLPHQTATEAAVFAERLRTSLSQVRLTKADDPYSRISVSIGVAGHWAQSPKHGAEQLLQAADAALYESKRRGRNRVVVYERDLQLPPREALQI